MSRKPEIDLAKALLYGFKSVWELQLSPIVENCKQLSSASSENSDKNALLRLLVNSYISWGLEKVIQKIAEVGKIAGQTDLIKIESCRELKRIIAYRDKLIAHGLENQGKKIYGQLLSQINKADAPLFFQISNAANELIESTPDEICEVHKNSSEVQIEVCHKIEKEDLELLAELSPTLKLRPTVVDVLGRRLRAETKKRSDKKQDFKIEG